MAKVNIKQGDCLELMKTIESQSVDLIICDPLCKPY
jgi:DNA modification methylase